MSQRVGYFLFRPIFGNLAASRQAVIEALNGVRADLIVLPELAFTGYTMTYREAVAALAEDPADSPRRPVGVFTIPPYWWGRVA